MLFKLLHLCIVFSRFFFLIKKGVKRRNVRKYNIGPLSDDLECWKGLGKRRWEGVNFAFLFLTHVPRRSVENLVTGFPNLILSPLKSF